MSAAPEDGQQPLVLVVVGTDVHRFDRLMDWLRRWYDAQPRPPRLVVQYGTSTAPGLPGACEFLDHSGLQQAMADATLVVCHGGPATITEARRHRNLPIVVPRDPARDEHVDNHQQLFSRRLGAAGMVRLCEDESEFTAALDAGLADPGRYRLDAAHDAEQSRRAAVARVGEVIDGLAAARRLPPPGRSDAPDTPRVLFVGGLGRSGSTLLELLLAASPAVCPVGEVVHLWERGLLANERCGCGELFAECPFWEKVGRVAFGGWDQIDPAKVLALKSAVDRTRHIPRLARRRLGPGVRSTIEEYADLYTRIYAAALEVSGASVVVDTSKHASLAFALRWAHDLDLRVVHLVRDSRGVTYSWSKQVRRPEVADAEAYMPRYSPVGVAALWNTQNAAFHLLDRRGVPVHRLRYEDLTADPLRELALVREFAGLSPDPTGRHAGLRDVTAGTPGTPDGVGTGLELPDGLPAAHTVAGNPLRFAGGPLRIRPDLAWRSAMAAGSRRLVASLTLPLAMRYGYLRRGGDLSTRPHPLQEDA